MLPLSILHSSQYIGGKLLSQWGQLFLEHMQSIDAEFDPGHRVDHVIRVTNVAVEIAEQEGADLAVVLPAVILHDTKPVGKFHPDRPNASRLSAEHAIRLLSKWGYPTAHHAAIEHAILTHSFSAAIPPETLEAKVVQDADRLDALGAIGIARTMAVGFHHGLPLYMTKEPFPGRRDANDQTNILDHFYLKLFQLPASLHTSAAKKKASLRIQFMESYLQALAEEIGTDHVSYKEFMNIKARKAIHNR